MTAPSPLLEALPLLVAHRPSPRAVVDVVAQLEGVAPEVVLERHHGPRARLARAKAAMALHDWLGLSFVAVGDVLGLERTVAMDYTHRARSALSRASAERLQATLEALMSTRPAPLDEASALRHERDELRRENAQLRQRLSQLEVA